MIKEQQNVVLFYILFIICDIQLTYKYLKILLYLKFRGEIMFWAILVIIVVNSVFLFCWYANYLENTPEPKRKKGDIITTIIAVSLSSITCITGVVLVFINPILLFLLIPILIVLGLVKWIFKN